jgi:hypothetical protein
LELQRFPNTGKHRILPFDVFASDKISKNI